MILAEFSKFLQQHNDELITHKTTPIKLLHSWLYAVINKNPKNHAEKIVHKEIMYAQNKNGDYLIVGKSDSGRKLVTALINFCESYENYYHAKWIETLEKNYKTENKTI
ncbi:hypothetical protein J6G99_03895 [bacterium]|nr:hypothetical protein [bacterium]